MNKISPADNHEDALDTARALLLDGKSSLERTAESMSGAEFVTAAATLAGGFVQLAEAMRCATTSAQEFAEQQRRAAAEARPHDDNPRFVGFTEHGHPVIDRLPVTGVARCGGPQGCGKCADDAGDLRRAAREARRA